MDNTRNAGSMVGATASTDTNDRTDVTSNSSADNLYTQAMMRNYEQQLSMMSSLNPAAAAASMFGYNPYMMASLTGMAGFGGLQTAGLPSFMGGAVGMGAPDYQTAMAAMGVGFPASALYSSMGYNGAAAGMGCSPADYVSAMAAYSASLASTNSSTSLPTAPLTTSPSVADRHHSSPALSQSNRSDSASATPGGQRQSSASTHKQSQKRSNPDLHSSRANHSQQPKKLKLGPGIKKKEDPPETNHHTEATAFFKGLTAEEFDVNTHFKNSLGSLYTSGLNKAKSSPSHSSVASTTATEQDTCLDLSIKSSSVDSVLNKSRSNASQASAATSNIVSRKSVIQSPANTSSPKSIPSALTLGTECSDNPIGKGYEALPNLKRLSKQLKTANIDTFSSESSAKSKHVVSLLKHSKGEGKVKRKSRVSKVNSGDLRVATQENVGFPISNAQRILEEERKEIERKLEWKPKPPRTGSKKTERNNQRSLPVPKNKSRRKSSQQPLSNTDADMIFPLNGLSTDNYIAEDKPKRTYIRTKIAREKPVDMSKLAIPFEYGWRREARVRGISKNGRMIGEVFYYTPHDKRMRSYNDVHKFLLIQKNTDTKQKGGTVEKPTSTIIPGVSDEACAPSEESQTDQPNSSSTEKPKQHNTDHSIARLTSEDSHVDKAGSPAATPTVVNGFAEESNAAESKTPDKDIVVCGNVKDSEGVTKNRPPQWEVLTKEHFSFNTKVKLGDFLEQKPGEKYVLLNDEERDRRIFAANEKRNRQLEKLNKIKTKKIALKETAKRLEQVKVEKERKQLELAQKSLQSKLQKQLEKERVKANQDMQKKQKAIALQMRRRQLMEERDRDRVERQERTKQLFEEREKKLQELKKHKAQQRLDKAMMRERQRLSLINSKIIETKKKEEERRRHQMEKVIQKERRAEIKKRQLELTRELKQPTEDLKLPHLKDLPTLNRIPGMKLPSTVFADVLQFHQFITNFYNCLEFKQSIPSLHIIQQALLCDTKQSKQAIQRFLSHMLSFALKDPGVASPNKFSNELGQKLSNLEVDEFNFSEILRMFMKERDGLISELSRELETKPFNALSAHMKSRTMVWLCDELNSSQAVTEDIDNNMESVLNLRRDKWELEGKMRELKSSGTSEITKVTAKSKFHTDLSDQSDNEDDTGNEPPILIQNTTSKPPTPTIEGKVETVDEKKLDKLSKQYNKCCKDVATKSGTVRTFPYGMDRFRRYYWCLPSFKGVLVESHESSVHESASGPTDSALKLEEPSPDKVKECKDQVVENTSGDNKTEPGAKTETVDIEPESVKPDNIKAELDETVIASRTDVNIKSTSTKEHIEQPDKLDYTRSIASWLNSTIDNIFTQQKGLRSTSQNSLPSSQSCSSLSSLPQAGSSSFIPNGLAHTSLHPSNSAGSLTEIDSWFELGRKLPCDKLDNFSPQLVANSLAFMNCATGSEEQRELEALERLAARAAVLERSRPLPADVQKGWWIMTDHEQIKSLTSSLHPRAIREKTLSRSLSKGKEKLELICSNQTMCTDVEFECDERDSAVSASPYHAPVYDTSVTWVEKQCRTTELSILDKIEDLEERVFQASIYTKNWAEKKKHDATDLELVVTPVSEVKEGEKRIIDLVKEKLLLLEAGIERRYLKPPFIKSNALQLASIVSSNNGTSDAGSDSESDSGSESKANEEACSKGLLQWQRAVRSALNLSQLYISLNQLESCVAWEKSVMRVLCQVCRSDDNEDQLLLCDNCDKGYHTYCFKPKMTNIPSGDWYCWECKSKATSVPHCIRCGKSTGKMAQCHKCPQAIHLTCCSPVLNRVPRKHTCGHCLKISNQRGKKRKQRTPETSDNESDNEDSFLTEEIDDVDERENDITVCRELMGEIEQHKDAQPFRQPVDVKAFPQYKKYIKQPMDLGKISNKLTTNLYKARTEFYDDMILIFDNCLLFNEDNSEVGKSGKSLRRQFLKRWKILTTI